MLQILQILTNHCISTIIIVVVVVLLVPIYLKNTTNTNKSIEPSNTIILIQLTRENPEPRENRKNRGSLVLIDGVGFSIEYEFP